MLEAEEPFIGSIKNIPVPNQLNKVMDMAGGKGIDGLIKKLGPESVKQLTDLFGVEGLNSFLGGGLPKFNKGGSDVATPSTTGQVSNSSVTLSNPLGNQPFRMGGGLGATRNHGPHQGIDLMVKTGTPVYAPADGVILKSHNEGGTCGGFVKIDHGDVITKYCHLSKWVAVPNAQVKKGDLIGYVGGGPNDPYRGNSSTSHLHYEVWDKNNNIALNPKEPQFGLA